MAKSRPKGPKKLPRATPKLTNSRRSLMRQPVFVAALALVITLSGYAYYVATHAATSPVAVLQSDDRVVLDAAKMATDRANELAAHPLPDKTNCDVFPNAKFCRQGQPGANKNLVLAPADSSKVGYAFPCTQSACGPLTYHGGPVQHQPRVYLLEWGPKWASNTYITPWIPGLIKSLGVENSATPDTWSTTTAQYYDNTGAPWFYNSHGKVLVDTSTPPHGVTGAQLAAEAAAALKRASSDTSTYGESMVIVATQSGTCPQGFAGDGTTCPKGNYFGWHTSLSVSSGGNTYKSTLVNLPWQSDIGGNAPGGSWRNMTSYVLGHEFAETVTDPQLNAWYSSNFSGEIGDECGGSNSDTSMDGGTYLMTGLYSNAAGGCVYTSGVQGAIVNKNGLCVDDASSSVAGGNKIDIWGCNQSHAQRVTHFQDGSLQILGRCLTDSSSGGAGSKITLNACNGTPNKTWSYDATNQAWKLKLNGLCLRNPGGTANAGTQLDIYNCTSFANETWTKPQGQQ